MSDTEEVSLNEEATNTISTYHEYSAQHFVSATRYRSITDITASTIINSRSEGFDRYEIGRFVGINTRTKAGNRRVSAPITQLCQTFPQHLGQYQKMEGKYRTLKYFFKGESATPAALVELFSQLKALTKLEISPFNYGDIVKFPNKNLTTLRISDVTLRRFVMILEMLRDEDVLVTTHRLARKLSERERALGYTFMLDRKSLLKCLYALEKKHLIRILELHNVHDDEAPNFEDTSNSTGGVTVTIIAPPDVRSVDDPRVQSAVERSIKVFHEEGYQFPAGQLRAKEKEPKAPIHSKKKKERAVRHADGSPGEAIEDEEQEEESFEAEATPADLNSMTTLERFGLRRFMFDRLSDRTSTKLDKKSAADYDEALNYGYQSKMVRCALLHEYAFRVVHELDRCDTRDDGNRWASVYDRYPPTQPLPTRDETSMPLPLTGEIEDAPTIENPLRHVAPIPPFADPRSRGWFMLRDLVAQMPLSLFALLVRIKRPIEGLDEALADPERRHSPLAELPTKLRAQLFTRTSCAVIEHTCLLLCYFGLMRVALIESNERGNIGPTAFFFCGRRTYLLDTSSSERGYALVTPPPPAPEKYTRYDYVFRTREDIYKYWNHLKAIACSTRLNARLNIDEPKLAPGATRDKFSTTGIERAPVQVTLNEELETLEPIGQADGCAGMDSRIFCHLKRHWELRTASNDAYVEWFIKRWHHFAQTSKTHVESRVSRLESYWNSCLASFLPADSELTNKKRAGMPILTQKTLDSMSGRFRRHYNVSSALNTHIVDSRHRVKPRRSALSTIGGPLSASTPKAGGIKKRRGSARAAVVDDDDEGQVDEEAEDETMDVDQQQPSTSRKQTGGKQKTRKGKRRFDEIDLESKQRSVFPRTRFTAREHDMLVLIRAVSFFLNPVHRFWLSPVVMRDIMHEFISESRDKTVPSLLAASAREMARPGRIAQAHHLVKTLGTYPELVDTRNKLVTQQFENEAEKNEYFVEVFRQAHAFIFKESNNAPTVRASDDELRRYIEEQTIAPAVETPASIFPRRSRAPQSADDVRHCVAYNTIISTMIGDFTLSADAPERATMRVNELFAALPPSAVADALETCRADGLISRVRNVDMTPFARIQTVLSMYFRHFFSHHYRNDLVDLVRETISHDAANNPQTAREASEASTLTATADDDPAGLLKVTDALCREVEVPVDLSDIEQVFVRNNEETTKPKTDADVSKINKQLRYLENEPIYVEKIGVNTAQLVPTDIRVPTRDDVLPLVCRCYTEHNDETAERYARLAASSAAKDVPLDVVKRIVEQLDTSSFHGVAVKELERVHSEANGELLDALIVCGLAFSAGVDIARLVSGPNIEPWAVRIGDRLCVMRPWSYPNGDVNWTTLRWMSEGVLLTICFKPAIKVDELCSLYSYVLQPVCVRELLKFLAKLDCIRVRAETRSSMRKSSPFCENPNAIIEEFAMPTVGALQQFAKFFNDTPTVCRAAKK